MPDEKPKLYLLTLTVRAAVVVCLAVTGAVIPVVNAEQPKCLYVSSYHKGFGWSDGVEEGLRAVLSDRCQLRQFDMNTLRQKSHVDKRLAARQAVEIIQSWKPDIVITSDDNAAKYLIVPFYRNSALPFVFSGVNWTVEEYGFPFDNVTGIVEVSPVAPMLQKAIKLSGGTTAVYLGTQTPTEEKNFAQFSEAAIKLGVNLEQRMVSSFAEWLSAFTYSQSKDFLIIGSNSGIDDWNRPVAEDHVLKHGRIVSVTNHERMMNVTLTGFTNIPQEQGEWAGEAALAILEGTPVVDIPVVTNRKWELWLNDTLADVLDVSLPAGFTQKAKKLVLAE